MGRAKDRARGRLLSSLSSFSPHDAPPFSTSYPASPLSPRPLQRLTPSWCKAAGQDLKEETQASRRWLDRERRARPRSRLRGMRTCRATTSASYVDTPRIDFARAAGLFDRPQVGQEMSSVEQFRIFCAKYSKSNRVTT